MSANLMLVSVLEPLSPERVLLVALDIGKDVHLAYARTGQGAEVLPPTLLATRQDGFATFTAHVDAWLTGGQYDLVRLGHEPTGIYHEAWSAALVARYRPHLTGQATPPLQYWLVVPHQVKAERQRRSHRFRKTDVIDAQAIARLLAEGQGTPLPLLPTADQQLRLTLGQLRQLGKQQLRVQVDLLRLLDRLWPGALGNQQRYQRAHPDLPLLLHLVDSRPLERIRVRILLAHCPDPHAVRALGVTGIQALFRQHGERCGPVTAQRVLAVFTQALLPPPALSATLAQHAQQRFTLYQTYETQLATLEATAIRLLPETAGQVLTTMPGVSPLLAARYLAGIGGDVTRFPSTAHLWSYAGYDPVQADSGNGRYTGGISHHGSPSLRMTLFQLAFLTSVHNPASARVYVRARERGMAEVPALIHVAHHVNQVCYALLTTQQPYRPPLDETAGQRWLTQAQALRKRPARRVEI